MEKDVEKQNKDQDTYGAIVTTLRLGAKVKNFAAFPIDPRRQMLVKPCEMLVNVFRMNLTLFFD